MRFAIVALLTLFLVGTIFAQDAPSAQDTASAQDATQATAPPLVQTDDQPAAQADAQPAAQADAQPAAQTDAQPAAQADAQPAAQEAPKASFAFHGDMDLGSDVLLTGVAGAAQTWTRLGFQPDFSFGKFGIGFDLTIHFMLYPTQNDSFDIYPGDWVPNYNGDGKSFFDVYLPKILYIRYGLKGEDPLFMKLGSIDSLSLGNNFIMSNYSNMHFLPEQRIFGLDLGLDGALFNFPYVGIEALTGNLARFDVVGGRVYARPLVGTSIPILKNMQVGATIVADTKPDLYANTKAPATAIAAYGADITVPILSGKAFPLVTFTDVAIDPNKTAGWMLGFGGRLIGVITYGAQLRVLQGGFIPSYFDANYDIFRAQKYDYMQLPPPSGIYTGWFASLGASLFSDIFIFNTELDGPFSGDGINPSASDQTKYPHLRAIIQLNRIDKFPFYFDASYDRYFIGAKNGFFQDLVDPTDAVIGLNVNYKTGASVLTLAYNAQWDPANNKFNVTSSLFASMSF